jgi:hypothetical protein
MGADQAAPRRGCFFYGCLGAAILFLVVASAIFLGANAARKMVREFTDDSPMKFPESKLTPEQVEQVQNRVSVFQQGLRQNQAVSPLALSAEEINALINVFPAAKPIRGKIHVIIQGNELKGEVSVKLKELGLPVFKERYLNAVMTLGVSLQDGRLLISPQQVTVAGRSLPRVYLHKITKQNLAREVNEDPRTSIALEKLEKVEIKDGKLIIVPKG